MLINSYFRRLLLHGMYEIREGSRRVPEDHQREFAIRLRSLPLLLGRVKPSDGSLQFRVPKFPR